MNSCSSAWYPCQLRNWGASSFSKLAFRSSLQAWQLSCWAPLLSWGRLSKTEIAWTLELSYSSYCFDTVISILSRSEWSPSKIYSVLDFLSDSHAKTAELVALASGKSMHDLARTVAIFDCCFWSHFMMIEACFLLLEWTDCSAHLAYFRKK